MKSAIAKRVLLILSGIGVAVVAVSLSPAAHAQIGLEAAILAAIAQVQEVMSTITTPALQATAASSQL